MPGIGGQNENSGGDERRGVVAKMYPLGWLCDGKRWRRTTARHCVARYAWMLWFIGSGRSQSFSWLHEGLVFRNQDDSIRAGDRSKTKCAGDEGSSIFKEALWLSPEPV